MSDSVRSHRRQPSRLPCPWDSPGKNTGVGCHFLLQCMNVKSESEVAQSCPTLSDPMDCSPPGSSSMGFSRREYWSGVLLALQIHEATSSFGVIAYTTTFAWNHWDYLSYSQKPTQTSSVYGIEAPSFLFPPLCVTAIPSTCLRKCVFRY